jgi:drug/metabolite transporter (DMT)-like permease
MTWNPNLNLMTPSKKTLKVTILNAEYGLLYVLCILIWGSTWYGVHLQMGQVRPELSVGLRFFAASFFLFIFCFIQKTSLRFRVSSHLLFLAQGACVFFLGYIFSYKAVQYITSGVVAVFYCLMPFFNIVFSRIFFRNQIEWRVVVGAFLGLFGVSLVFGHEWNNLKSEANMLWGILFAFLGAGFGSLGNMAAVKMAKLKFSVAAWNAWGMLYGSLMSLTYCYVQKVPFVIDSRFVYWGSFAFLSLFGSVIAFGAYYRLQNKIGAARASYMTVFFPIIALIYSWAFENYQWSAISAVGVLFVLTGNLWIIPKKQRPPIHSEPVALPKNHAHSDQTMSPRLNSEALFEN